MTLLEKINKLNYVNLINKLKDILKGLNDKPSGGYEPPYKVYTALLTQSGTNAPVATVLENTLGGEVVLSYTGVGDYLATLPTEVDLNKAAIISGSYYNSLSGAVTSVEFGDAQNVRILSEEEINVTGTPTDLTNANELLLNTPIEIRVYN